MTTNHFDRLASLFSELDDAVVVADANRKITYANAAAERVFGYGKDELHGAPTTLIYATEADYVRLGRERFSGKANGVKAKHRVFYRRKSGETFASETVTSNIYGDDGTVIGFLGIIRDITDRLAVEDAAAAAATTLQDAIDSIDEGFALYDADDRLAVCNERYREVYPKSAKAMVPGAAFEDVLRAGLGAREYDTGAKPDDQWLEERMRVHRRADGTRIEQHLADGRWVQIRERRTRRGGTAGIRADITALKTAEQKVAEVRRDRETLANNMPCLIEELDSAGRCVFINSLGAAWLGTTAAAAVNQRTGELFDLDDQAKLRPYREAALAGRPVHAETQLRFPDGELRDVILDYIPKTDAGGHTVGTFVSIVNVTEQKKVERTLRRLHRIVSSDETGRERKLDLIVEAGCAHFDLPTGVIGLIEGEDYTVLHACSRDHLPAPGAQLRLGQTYCAEMLKSEGSIAVEDVAASPLRARECYEAFRFESYVGAPIYTNGALYGALFFAGPEPRRMAFTDGDHAIIKQLADWIGNEVARERDLVALRRANAELERLAKTDELTGILNRREFCRRAEVELERARRYSGPVSVAIIDIDHFKQINDRYGHAAGDEVLRLFAERIATILRPTDIFGRLGGEEFAIVLGHTDIDSARVVADRVQVAIGGSYLLGERKEKVELTISIGVAAVWPTDSSIARTLDRADRAMYSAKSAGRNRVAVFSGDALAEQAPGR